MQAAPDTVNDGDELGSLADLTDPIDVDAMSDSAVPLVINEEDIGIELDDWLLQLQAIFLMSADSSQSSGGASYLFQKL